MLLTAAALTGNSQKRKEGRMRRAKQTWRRLRNFYKAIFISKLFVSAATLNCLISGVLRLYDCTVPITVCYMLLLNSLLGFCELKLFAINLD